MAPALSALCSLRLLSFIDGDNHHETCGAFSLSSHDRRLLERRSAALLSNGIRRAQACAAMPIADLAGGEATYKMIWLLIVLTLRTDAGGFVIEYNSEAACNFARQEIEVHVRAARCTPKGELAAPPAPPVIVMRPERQIVHAQKKTRRLRREVLVSGAP